MASGCPVITSGTTSLPEVAGDAALLINPESVEEMAAAMNHLLMDTVLRTKLREQGLKRAAQFSWRQAAEQTLAVYRKVAASL
jgi:glycosyltransferase involved in cell wall biosynthesis